MFAEKDRSFTYNSRREAMTDRRRAISSMDFPTEMAIVAPAGDPVEAEAIATVSPGYHVLHQDLFAGFVKTFVGHSEAACCWRA